VRRRLVSLGLLALTASPVQAGALSAADLEAAAGLRDAALSGSGAYEIVASLTTEVGSRPPGSEGDRAALSWAECKFAELGLVNIRRQPVPVPHWERGSIEARTVSPFPQPLVATALGGSIGTPEQGIESDIVRFGTLDELRGAVKTLGGADILPLMRLGVPALQVRQDWTRYLDAHHSPNDTLDRIDREQIDQVVAAYVATAFLAAQAEGGFGRIEPPARPARTTSGSEGSR